MNLGSSVFFKLIVIGISVLWALVLHAVAQYIVTPDACTSCISTRSTKILTLIITPIIFVSLTYQIIPCYWPALFFFVSALLVATITDMQALVISRFTSLFLVPLAWVCAWCSFLPLTTLSSIIGTISGYAILYAVAFIFRTFMHKDGIGEGDYELLALIGACTGPYGVWISLLIGSLIGSLLGVTLLCTQKIARTTLIPFGPFLALGAIVYITYGQELVSLFLG